MKIGQRDVSERVLVIAEVGNNHEGNFELARKMIHLAAEAGADVVKFQTIIPDRLVSVQNKERIAQLSRFQFSYDQFRSLAEESKKANILFMSTPFDLESVEVLNPLVPAFKIASGDNDFYPLIDSICKTGKPIILSTGLATAPQVEAARSFIFQRWKKYSIEQELALLHCVSSYPVPEEQANLSAIFELKKLGVIPGYSDHTLGIDACVYAVACGARIVEKHFTIDKNHSTFRDHQLSADPKDLKELVDRIRKVESMLGTNNLNPQACEENGQTAFRRSIVAKNYLSKGQVIGFEHLSWVRPRNGLKPGEESLLIGRPLKKDIPAGAVILKEDVEA